MANEEDYYVLLGVKVDASDLEIRRAYRQKVLEFHPDRRPGDAAAETKFKQIAEAYAILGSADRRSRYDASRVQEDIVTMVEGARAAVRAPEVRTVVRPTRRGERFQGAEEASVRQLTGTFRTHDAMIAVLLVPCIWELSRIWIASDVKPQASFAVIAGVASALIGALVLRIAVTIDENARYPVVNPAGALTTIGATILTAAFSYASLCDASEGAWIAVATLSAAVGAVFARALGRAFLAEATSTLAVLFARLVGGAAGAAVTGCVVTIPLGLTALAAFVKPMSDGMLHSGMCAVLSATLCGIVFRGDAR